MVTHMKTTIEISDRLLEELRDRARSGGTTMRRLLEEAITSYLAEEGHGSYVLPDCSFSGNGLQPGLSEGDWDTIRTMIYEDRT